MAWTYDPTKLGNDTEEKRKNSVRLLVGDTDTMDQQVQDEEIVFALSQSSDNLFGAGAFIVSTLLSKYARLVNTELDEAIRADYSDLLDNYKAVYARLKSQGSSASTKFKILATGITITDVINANEDPLRIRPSFREKRFDNPAARS